MAYFSVLDLEQPDMANVSRPGFFWDLNLNQITDIIQQQSPQYDVLKMYCRFPVGEACARYRREIYGDVKRREVYECFQAFSGKMRKAASAAECRETVKTELQRKAWHVSAVNGYCTAVSGLQAALAGMELHSEGLRRLSEYLNSCTGQESFQKCSEEAGLIRQQMSELHLILEIEDNRVVITRGEGTGAYEKLLGDSRGAGKLTPFLGSPEMSPLEEAVFEAFRRKNPEFFDRVERFAKEYPDYEDHTILRLEQEIQYYLAFFRFEERMKEQGFAFCTPETDLNRDMEAAGLYDLALACANCARGRAVVSNDFAYRKGERFFVVGGPNQGGKTTFARSMGQLVYFGGMGLDVPAVQANVPHFTALLTHFSAEENLGSGKGKLKEELMRLAPMMKEQAEGAFVIINELFTTAAHYDGCVMGQRVLGHFIEKGCMGIYVTHLKELGNSVEGVAALTAMLDGSRERKRTYKISREKLEDVGYAEDIVRKYGLTYPELHRRLAGEEEGRQ
ncbi:MAG: hypothetical protein NC123_11555 [Butyrivibrio sp.]|nr:hypothetical protein [Acetatifactor muris]MCM1560160.1 hypothetical protein [Butyrivibrio sp.]